jgi:hypothetical protein
VALHCDVASSLWLDLIGAQRRHYNTIDGLRIVYSQHPGQIIRLEYADSRDVVYETFLKVLRERE